MAEMKNSEVVLGLAAQLASWRAVLVLLHTWATWKLWQRWDFHQYSIFLADCLNQSKQPVRESAGGAGATESKTVGRERRHADLDVPGANPEPELGPHGPTLKKKKQVLTKEEVLIGFDWLDLRLGLQPADSVIITKGFVGPKWETRAGRDDSSSSGVSSLGKSRVKSPEPLRVPCSMDPAGVPSSERKVAHTTRPSAVPGWQRFGRRFFCLKNGK